MKYRITAITSAGRDQGTVSIIVALALVLIIMPLLALTVDIGRVFVARSAQQHAADQAAMAAAWASCNGRDPVQAGLNSADRNGITTEPQTPEASASQIDIVHRGGQSWGASIDTEINGVFSPLVGVDTMRVSAHAAASCHTRSTTGPVIYAHASCHNAIQWSGNENTVTGDVHTNGHLMVAGNRNAHTGTATYSTSITVAGNQNTWHTASGSPTNPTRAPARGWPLSYDINDFDTGGVHASRSDYVAAPGTTTINVTWLRQRGYLVGSTLAPRIYYTDGKIDITDLNLTGKATFVARGDITFSGNNITFQPHFANIAAFSHKGTGACNQNAVSLTGNYITLTGIVYAPKGKVFLAGNYNRIDGTAVANQIDLFGNRLAINSGTGSEIPADPEVSLDTW